MSDARDAESEPLSSYAQGVYAHDADAPDAPDYAAAYEPEADFGEAAFGVYPDVLDDADPAAARDARGQARAQTQTQTQTQSQTQSQAEARPHADARARDAGRDAPPSQAAEGEPDVEETVEAERAFARLTGFGAAVARRLSALFARRAQPSAEPAEELIAPALRQALAQGAPLLAGAAAAAAVIAFPPTREAAVATIHSLHEAVLNRPELRVRRVELIGAERVDVPAVISALGLTADQRASLAFDASDARRRIERLGWVKHARVALRPPQTLEVEVRERVPAMLWRVNGRLRLLDPDGVEIERPLTRWAWPGLPLIVGQGADQAIHEAQDLDRAARAAGLPIAALTRIGERRWDLELAEGPRVRLPEERPIDAIHTVGQWAAERGVLERGFAMLDLRLAHAPVARFGPKNSASDDEAAPNPEIALEGDAEPAVAAAARLRTSAR